MRKKRETDRGGKRQRDVRENRYVTEGRERERERARERERERDGKREKQEI